MLNRETELDEQTKKNAEHISQIIGDKTEDIGRMLVMLGNTYSAGIMTGVALRKTLEKS